MVGRSRWWVAAARTAPAFQQNYEALVRGDDGMISERAISPAGDLPSLADVVKANLPEDQIKKMLEQTVVLKLNGG
ncbi:hypothetical protein T484DRAFT_1861168, partial [Baffinella frigidus]